MVDGTGAVPPFKTVTLIRATIRIQVPIRATIHIQLTTHIRQTEIAELTATVTAISIGTIASLTDDTAGSIVTGTGTLIATTPGAGGGVPVTVSTGVNVIRGDVIGMILIEFTAYAV